MTVSHRLHYLLMPIVRLEKVKQASVEPLLDDVGLQLRKAERVAF